jgi:hypothetical protein
MQFYHELKLRLFFRRIASVDLSRQNDKTGVYSLNKEDLQMRNLVALSVVGFLASASLASATVPGLKVFCEFEGRGLSDHHHQDEDVRCRAEAFLPLVVGAEATPPNAYYPESKLEVKCSNGYRLETEKVAFAIGDETLWINGEKREKFATIRVRDYEANAVENESEHRFRADLVAVDSRSVRAEGRCKIEYPVTAPPAPQAPAAPVVPVAPIQ